MISSIIDKFCMLALLIVKTMDFRDLLKTGWTIYRRSTLIHWLATVTVVVTALDMLAPSGGSRNAAAALGFACFSFLVYLSYTFIETGLIRAVLSDQSGQPAALRDAWETFRARFGSLLLVLFIFFAILFVLILFVLIAAFILGLAKVVAPGQIGSIALVPLVIIIVPCLLMIQFAYRASVVSPDGRFSSALRGLRLLPKNVGSTLLLLLAYLALQMLIKAIASLMVLAIASPARISLLTGPNFNSLYTTLLLSPTAKVVTVILSPLFTPLYSIILTLIYLHADRREGAPAIEPQPAVS